MNGLQSNATVFDYAWDTFSNSWVPWSSMICPSHCIDISTMATGGSSEALDMASVFIHTTETVRIQYILNLLIKNGHHCMLVGGPGTGKTSIIKDVLQRLDSELCTCYFLSYCEVFLYYFP